MTFVYGPPGPITDAFRYSNYVEGFFWIAVGGLATKASRDRGLPRLGWVFLAVFFVFGCSDWVESTTGAWYWPWWLLAWKALCVVTIVGLTITGARLKRRETSKSRVEPRTK